MSKVLFTLPHGIVFTRTARVKGENDKITVISEPTLRGNPAKFSEQLMKAHGTSGALGLVDSLKSTDKFWTAVRQSIVSKLKKLNAKIST
jgi:hypothetical protein